MGALEMIWTCLRRGKVIHGKTSLFVATQGYLLQLGLVCCKSTLSGSKQGYPRQNSVIYGETRLSRAS
jgi:hypothetical protein